MEDENPAVKTQLSGNRNYSDIRKRKKKNLLPDYSYIIKDYESDGFRLLNSNTRSKEIKVTRRDKGQ